MALPMFILIKQQMLLWEMNRGAGMGLVILPLSLLKVAHRIVDARLDLSFIPYKNTMIKTFSVFL